MQHIIIGTAGHVDHGKTTLIRALTGTDTDRLKEEKKRGITIDLGFAHLQLSDDISAGIVDVPGHEKFIKNMLAGAIGIDMVLLIIAADEGFMPQTREHLSILQLLDIQHGLVVLTKTDTVEKDWLTLVTEDIKQQLSGSFLQHAPILPVSAFTAEGLDALKEAMLEIAKKTCKKDTSKAFRLPIDRVFTVEGFGTVVTGTMLEGSVQKGEDVTLYPSNLKAKVRTLQVHDNDVDTAFAGQRVAMNLSGIKTMQLQRGDIVAKENSLQPSSMLDVHLTIVEECDRVIENNTRLHLYTGTGTVLCRLLLLDAPSLKAGESGYAQLRLSKPVCVKEKDRYVLRFYSPLETIGGGVIVESQPKKHRAFEKGVIDALKIKHSGSKDEILLQLIKEKSAAHASVQQLQQRTALPYAEMIELLQQSDDVFLLYDDVYVHREYVEMLSHKVNAFLQEYHQKNPLLPGMKKEALRSQVFADASVLAGNRLLEILGKLQAIFITDGVVQQKDFMPSYTKQQQSVADALLAYYEKAAYTPDDLEEVASAFQKQSAVFLQVLSALLYEEKLIRLDAQIFLHRSHYEKAKSVLIEIEHRDGEISLAAFRDALSTSRKYALPLLEKYDEEKVTKKTGDMRHVIEK